jgi:HPt (histidine-containing phosphotransfer) domain-containing protein
VSAANALQEGVVIDWTRISVLRAEIGDDDLHEVIGLFLEETDEVIARLDDGVDVSDLESLLHFLKGSALNLGFSDLAVVCQEGERKAAMGEGAGIDLEQVIDLYCASRTTFTDGLTLHLAA